MDAIRRECMAFFRSPEGVPLHQQRTFTCSRCFPGCGGAGEGGEYSPAVSADHSREYETLAAIGSLMRIDNLAAIIQINDLCNRGGADSLATARAMAFAMKCYNQGLLTKEDTGGLDLSWGHERAVLKLTQQIMNHEGFGVILADGTQKARERICLEADRAARPSGGEEILSHDLSLHSGPGRRSRREAAPGRSTPSSAWLHESGFAPVGLEQYYPAPADPGHPNSKAKAHRILGNWGHVVNAAGVCLWGACAMPARALPEFLSAAMGREVPMAEVMEIGHRIATLRAAFNAREGYGPPTTGKTILSDTELPEYFAAMGWDERGKPTLATLEKLGLGYVAAELFA